MQPDLLAWRAAATTSGPRPTAADGMPTKATSRERWDAFVAAHYTVATAMLDVARARHARGERVSAKAIVEWARAEFRISINNTMTAAIGDWFAEQIPGVKVERRARKATP